MKQGYKCNFCSSFGNKTEITEHERKCVFNPSTRHCMTCTHFIDAYPQSYNVEECRLKNTHFLKVLDEEVKCDIWETMD